MRLQLSASDHPKTDFFSSSFNKGVNTDVALRAEYSQNSNDFIRTVIRIRKTHTEIPNNVITTAFRCLKSKYGYFDIIF